MPDLRDLFRHATNTVTFEAGQTIFEEGQPGDIMYVIQEGEIDIVSHGRLLETVGAGEIVGEMALIDNEPRSASAIARTACTLVPVTQKRFLFMVQETPFFAIDVMHLMANRLRRLHT